MGVTFAYRPGALIGASLLCCGRSMTAYFAPTAGLTVLRHCGELRSSVVRGHRRSQTCAQPRNPSLAAAWGLVHCCNSQTSRKTPLTRLGGARRLRSQHAPPCWLRFILKGCQRLAGGRRQAHHWSRNTNETHPKGMKELVILAPISGCNRRFRYEPVVALRLPPANFLNRSAVNRRLCCGRSLTEPLPPDRRSHCSRRCRNVQSQLVRGHRPAYNQGVAHWEQFGVRSISATGREFGRCHQRESSRRSETAICSHNTLRHFDGGSFQ
jgi:hypothetical protein